MSKTMLNVLATLLALLSVAAAEPTDQALADLLPETFSGQIVIGGPSEIIARETFGAADRKQNLPVDNATLFDVGSLTKQFTAAGILKLNEQEKLSLDEPLRAFFDGLSPDVGSISLHALLTHASGMPNSSGGDYSLRDRASFDKWLRKVKLKRGADPFAYSNAGYSVLARIIEIRSGETYEAFLAEHLWRPAGLTDIGYRLPPSNLKEAVGYGALRVFGTPRSKKWLDDGPSWNLRGNGGVIASAETMYQWTAALTSGKILSQPSLELLFSRHAMRNKERGVWYGYGWEVRDMDYGERISHSGGNLVFFAYVEYLKEQQCILSLTNNAFSQAEIGDVIRATRQYTLDHAQACK